MRFANFLLLFAAACVAVASSASASSNPCSYSITEPNSTYRISNASCGSFNITFHQSAYNSSVVCANTAFGSSSTLTFEEGSVARIYNCSLDNAKMTMLNGSHARIIGASNVSVEPAFTDNSSSVEIAYYLDVNVFEPFGYSSLSPFGERVAGFGYVLPLLNDSIRLHNTQLQMELSDSPEINRTFEEVASIAPFGVYNQSESEIYNESMSLPYGTIAGSRRFVVPSYAITRNGIVRYNPYAVEYAFFAYDQLIMFRINVTGNTALTPIYVQPVYPKFNLQNIPDNGNNDITIRYIIAVPPQDSSWNFTSMLYRYNSNEGFALNPLNGSIGNDALLASVLSFPSNSYAQLQNGTRIYMINYSTSVKPGLNSSIMITRGTIPGIGSFIQDSTTPSFSYGLSYCSSVYNQSYPYTFVSAPGNYTMADDLMPLQGPAIPVLVSSRCAIGLYVNGSDISINCRGRSINDTGYGMILNHARNVRISGCRIHGNGLLMANSSNVSVYDTRIEPSANASSFGISVINSTSLSLHNTTVANGFSSAYSQAGSSGINFNSSSAKQLQSGPGLPNLGSEALNESVFIASSGILIIIYVYLAMRQRIMKHDRRKMG